MYGVSRWRLFLRYFLDVIIQVSIAFILSLILLILCWPYYQAYTDVEINRVYNFPELAICAGFILILIVLIASAYPVLMLASIKPDDIFHKRIFSRLSISTINKAVIVVQVSFSGVFIIASIFIYLQTRYIMSKDLGLKISNVLNIRLSGTMRDHRQDIKNRLLNLTGIQSVTYSSDSPLYSSSYTTDPTWLNKGNNVGSIYVVAADFDYISTLNIKIREGRDFDNLLKTDTANYLINETLSRIMGSKNAIGNEISLWGNKGKVIGIVNDYHYQKLHEPIQPLIIRLSTRPTDHLLIKLSEDISSKSLASVEKILLEYSGGNPIELNRLDNEMKSSYQQDVNLSILAAITAILSICIAALGVFGVISFLMQGRSKEIGIRKILGAFPGQILVFMTKDYMLIVLMAGLLATPIAYFAINKWFESFAYHIVIVEHLWVFILSIVMSLLVAILTISFQTIKSAISNPINSLRSE